MSDTAAGKGAYPSHTCDDSCAHTIDVGYVHTPDDQGICRPACPHPDHKPAVYDWDAVLGRGDSPARNDDT